MDSNYDNYCCIYTVVCTYVEQVEQDYQPLFFENDEDSSTVRSITQHTRVFVNILLSRCARNIVCVYVTDPMHFKAAPTILPSGKVCLFCNVLRVCRYMNYEMYTLCVGGDQPPYHGARN